jgi:hypothetical protein
VIAALGADNSLDFYWQPNGGKGWNATTVAGRGTTYFVPKVVADGTAPIITAQGAGNSLEFYWAASVSSAWHEETVAGTGTTFSVPGMTVNGSSVNIAVVGPSSSLYFYWAANGSSVWTREVVAGAGTTTSAPAITANAGSVNVVALGPTFGARFYWAKDGTAVWHQDPLLPSFDTGPPAITTVPGGVHVLNIDLFGHTVDDSTVNGTGVWRPRYVTGGFLSAGGFPDVTANDGVVNVAQFGSDGNLYFSWDDDPYGFIQELVDTKANL